MIGNIDEDKKGSETAKKSCTGRRTGHAANAIIGINVSTWPRERESDGEKEKLSEQSRGGWR